MRRAIAAGRLSTSVTRDAAGHPKIADPELADREWAQTTKAEHVPHAARKRAPRAADTQPEADPDSGGNTLAAWRVRSERARAERAELELAERRGELVSASEIGQEYTAAAANVRTKILSVPAKFKARFMDTPYDRIEALDTLLRQALLDLSRGAGHDDGAIDIEDGLNCED